MLFLVWLAVSFLIVAAINIYLRHFGLPRRQLVSVHDTRAVSTAYYSSQGATGQAIGHVGLQQGESARWINTLMTWIHQRTSSSSQRSVLMEAWLKALTEHAEQYSRELRVRFDDVRGSLPEFSNFSVDPSSLASGPLNVYMTVAAKDVTLQICIAPTNDSGRTVYSDVYLLHLHGQLKVAISSSMNTNETPVHLSFLSTPELRLQVLPSGRLEPSVDVSSIEKVVRMALGDAVTKVTWSSAGGIRTTTTPRLENQLINNYQPVTPSGQMTQHTVSEQNFVGYRDTVSQQKSQPQFSQPLYTQQQQQQIIQPQQQQLQYGSVPGNVPRTPDVTARPADISGLNNCNEGASQRLLVKIIKANGLTADSGSCNAYCLVRLDRPSQNFMTAVVRNTVNPMWDEQFVFNIDSFSSQIQFDVLDRDKSPDSELLGKAVVQLDEIRRMPSSRQILPLTGRLRNRTATSGSVTIEFVLNDAIDMTRVAANDNMMTSQHTMAGRLTPTITHNDPMMKATTDYGAYQNRLSAHDLALSQQAGIRQQESPSVVVTGTELQRSNVQTQGTLDGRGRGQTKESFASALKKRLSRGGGKKRSQSADRAQTHTQSLHEGSAYLRPPGDSMQGFRTTDTIDDHKARSNSFTSSLRRMFKPSTAAGKKDISREGSLTRNQPVDNYDRSLRQGTPVPPGGEHRVPPGGEHRDQYGNILNVTPGSERRYPDQSPATFSPARY